MSYVFILFIIYATYSTFSDGNIREDEYTQRLKNMPIVSREILDSVIKSNGSESDFDEMLKILAEGSVAQRNWEMQAVRAKISYVGQLFSWFLKQRGLTYSEIEKKFEIEFNHDAKRAYWLIIESASRSNPDLFQKFIGKFVPRAKL